VLLAKLNAENPQKLLLENLSLIKSDPCLDPEKLVKEARFVIHSLIVAELVNLEPVASEKAVPPVNR